LSTKQLELKKNAIIKLSFVATLTTMITKVKNMYFFPHKNMAKATKKGNNLLVECIDWINATSLILKEK